MLAGHTLIKVIAGFIALLGVAGVLPFALVVALTGLEILIAFQAYVFDPDLPLHQRRNPPALAWTAN